MIYSTRPVRSEDDREQERLNILEAQRVCKQQLESYEMVIAGLDPDMPTVVNEHGGKGSATPYRFDLIDARALFRLAEVTGMGAAKYGENNWRLVPVEQNINHAIQHLYAYLAGDTSDDHLGHAFTRCMMALAVHLAEQPQ